MQLLIVLACILVVCGCELFDPPRAEIGMHITKNGKDSSCLVEVWNDQGRQIQEVAPNELGVVYIKKLIAGTYFFKFKDHDGRYHPAERTVTLMAGATAYMPVELTQEKDQEAEAEASAAVRNYGENDLSL